jgi:hypothetical protein
MKYESWLTYPEMSIGVQLKKGEFHCSEFGTDQKKKQSLKICDSILELKSYLLSLPNPPKKEISELISKLKAKIIQ